MLSPQLIDHFQNPRNVGDLPMPARLIAVSNPVCGDELKLWLRFDGNRIKEVRYRVRGCTAAIASGSALTELLLTQPLNSITAAAVEAAVGGLAAESKHAAALCFDAVRLILKCEKPQLAPGL